MTEITLTIKVENEQELTKYIKAGDMACFICELVNNGWRDFKHTDYDYHKAWDKIYKLLEEHNINVDELG
jgi:hypothetical protein